ncbi:MAG TPA: hypothetical protein VHH35_18060 [Pyrinomonadaceae bacterium]|nr:hypothetical protein [Pyrinomonadaceae bacterium]
MSTNSHQIRIETLIALALSKRWQESDSAESNGDLSRVLAELSGPDRKAAMELAQRFETLPPAEQSRWLASRVGRIRASSPERERRFEADIHPSQIIEALRTEPPRIQSLIIGALPRHRDVVAGALGVSPASALQPGTTKIADVVRRAFFAQFVPASVLNDHTALDLLSGVELARLIRLLGVRETAIACKGVTAVEAVTAFLKRFSAEDAHAIRFHLASLTALDHERIVFAETVVRNAIAEGSIEAATLDRVGLTLLAMVLAESDQPRRRHTAQKLPLAASRQLDELLNGGLPECDPEIARHIIVETHSLAATLHHQPVEPTEDRRSAPLI